MGEYVNEGEKSLSLLETYLVQGVDQNEKNFLDKKCGF